MWVYGLPCRYSGPRRPVAGVRWGSVDPSTSASPGEDPSGRAESASPRVRGGRGGECVSRWRCRARPMRGWQHSCVTAAYCRGLWYWHPGPRVARDAMRRRAYAVVVVGKRGDIPCGDALVAAAPGGHSLCGHTELAGLIALIRRATWLITNDSGLVPIGDTMNCPMVVLRAGQRKGPETPRMAPVRWSQPPTACAPCYQSQCPHGQECPDIPPAEVVARALELMAGPGTPERADG